MLKTAFIIILIIIIFIVYFYFEYRNLEVTKYAVATHKNINCRAAIVSDLHNVCYDRLNMKLARLIYDNKCDMVLIPGDLIVDDAVTNDTSIEVLRNLTALDIPVYMSLGNHELKMRKNNPEGFKRLMEVLKDLGVIVLDNETVSCGSFFLSGYSGELCHYSKFQKLYELSLSEMNQKFINSVEETAYHILLAHNPVYFNIYKEWGADLVFSGHLHGGIIRLPFIGGLLSPQTFFKKGYDSGWYALNNSIMLVSRGLGVHTVPIRFNNRPELMIVDIK